MKKLLSMLIVMAMAIGCFGGMVLAKEPDDFNIGYEAEVNVTDEAGMSVPAGYNGANKWRTNIKSINDYYVDSEPNFWGTSYTLNPSVLPVNVDFDYGLAPAEIGQITLAEIRRSTAKPVETGTYTKIQIQYFDGTAWQTAVPADSGQEAYTVNDDASVSLHWGTPSRTDVLMNSQTLMIIDIQLEQRMVADKVRIKILEADGTNGDCWGEFGIDEILMYGQRASEDAVQALGTAYWNALAEKAVLAAEKLATAEQIAAAQEIVYAVEDTSIKAGLQSRLDAFAGKKWVNLAINATVTAGANPEGAQMLNDGNTFGTVPLSWEIPGTELDDNAWFQYDYGKEVTIKRIDLGARYVNNSISKIEIISILDGQETSVGTYDLKFGKVPEQGLYNPAGDFSKEAFAAFDREGQVLNDEVHYSDFCSIIFDSSFVCDALKIKVLEKNEPTFTAMCTEVLTYGTEGEDVTHHYTERNTAFNQPVKLYDTEENPLALSALGGRQKMAADYLTDYSIAADGWYEPAWPYDKLPFYLEVDYQREITEINRAVLGIGARTAGLISRLSMQIYDGTQWVDVLPAETQDAGVRKDGTDILLDWTKVSSSETDGTKTYQFMEIDFAQPVLAYKFRILVKEADSDGGIVHLEELLLWGWNPVWSDLDARSNAADLREKHAQYMLDRVFEDPTQKNMDAALAEIDKMTDENQKEIYQKVLQTMGVWDKLPASGSAGMGDNPGGLTDGLIGHPTNRWGTSLPEINENTWVQIDFSAPAQVSKLKMASRYYPDSIKKIDIYAKVGSEFILLEKDVELFYSHSPELTWYGNQLQFDQQAKQAYADSGLMRDDNLDMARASWIEIPLPKTVTCNGIKIQVLEAETSWGGYNIAEIEAIGRTGGEGNVFALGQELCLADGSQAESLAALKEQGGYFSADIGNPAAKQQEAVMFVMYYQNEALIGADSKKVVLGNGSILRDQTLAVNFEGEKAGCDKIKCYIWSNLGQEENAKGTGSWLEIQ